MARLSPDEALVNARIVYWGPDGCGKTTNLNAVYRKLRPDHRGQLERVPTRLDPTIEYEVLPIELGEIGGLRTRIQMIAVPGGPAHAATRKQLLDQVDGVVFVVDSQRERIDDNTRSLAELRRALDDYGLSLERVPLVLQYNKRDLSDAYVLDELHRALDLRGAAVFEAVATETTGVLQTLSTISKHVIRTLREQQFDVETAGPAPVTRVEAPPPSPPVEQHAHDQHAAHRPQDQPLRDEPVQEVSPSAARMEEAILQEEQDPDAGAIDRVAQQTETLLDRPWEEVSLDLEPDGAQLGPELSITSVGEATRHGERGVRVPIEVADKQGRRSGLVLTIQLDVAGAVDPD